MATGGRCTGWTPRTSGSRPGGLGTGRAPSSTGTTWPSTSITGSRSRCTPPKATTADTTHAVLGKGANRAAAYVAMTRGRASNSVYLYEKMGGEGDHEHADPTPGVHLARRGTSHDAAALLRTVLGRDDRARTVMETAADVARDQLPDPVRDLLDQHDRTRAACRTAYRSHLGSRAVERDLAAVLPALRAQVEVLEVAGGISGATGMYDVSDGVLAGVENESARGAVAAVVRDLHAVQVLQIHPDGQNQKAAVLAVITAAAHEHQARLSKGFDQARPGVLALPATPAAAAYAADHPYADTTARPGVAVNNFDSGRVSLPGGSVVIVDDADHLPFEQLRFLVEQAAVHTNTKLVLITNQYDGNADYTGPEAADAVSALQDHLPWAQQIGTAQSRNIESDSVIDRVRAHLATASADSSAHAEAAQLLTRHQDVAQKYRDEVTARDRFHTDMARSRDRSRDLGLSRDDGLEL